VSRGSSRIDLAGGGPSQSGTGARTALVGIAALLAELAYEVVEPGYQPPLTPAEMPGALGG